MNEKQIAERFQPQCGLRFDRVVVRLQEELRTFAIKNLAKGITAIVTLTAPVRQPRKVAEELKVKLMTQQKARVAYKNNISIYLCKASAKRAPKLLLFVHNPDGDPQALVDFCISVLGA